MAIKNGARASQKPKDNLLMTLPKRAFHIFKALFHFKPIASSQKFNIEKSPISRKTATQIAIAEADSRRIGFSGCEVVHSSEITYAPPRVYGINLDDCWIAYVKSADTARLIEPSTIIAIDRKTGDILYSGSANDEG